VRPPVTAARRSVPSRWVPAALRLSRFATGLARAVAAAALLALTSCGIPAAEAPGPSPAELVLRGGAVYTVDAARSWAEAVAVRGDRIVFVGTDADAETWIGPRTRVVDLGGRMLLPGFQDSHVHPDGGLDLGKVRLHGVLDRGEVFRRIREWAGAHPEASWVYGIGWEAGAFKPSGTPTRQMLDALVADRPALLKASDEHTGWANTPALALAKITKETPDPPNGRIGHDPASGEPDGVLYEAAIGLVERHMPEATREERLEGYRAGLDLLRRNGVTGIVDAGAQPTADGAYAEIQSAGELTARTILCQAYDPAQDDEAQIAEFVARRAALPAGDLRATCVKLLLDGIIEQYTGALLEPYLDGPRDRGPLFVEPKRLARLLTRLDAEGFQIHMHAIGDGAVREAVDALEAARTANGPRDARPSVDHVELLDPADIPRFRHLGITANMTPVWGLGDDLNTLFTEPRLGPERSRWLFAHKTLLDAGVHLVWGTDWPVTTISPLEGIETAITRRYPGGIGPDGRPDEAWMPQERIGLEPAIAAYTIAGAWLAFEEDERGSIEVGKRADLVVLERNLFQVPVLEIHAVHVDLTIFGARVVFERAPDPRPKER
jgi:predicted amidohydrolase YtcJ